MAKRFDYCLSNFPYCTAATPCWTCIMAGNFTPTPKEAKNDADT